MGSAGEGDGDAGADQEGKGEGNGKGECEGVDAAASANGKRGREVQLAGRVVDKAPTREDRKMVAEALQSREPRGRAPTREKE